MPARLAAASLLIAATWLGVAFGAQTVTTIAVTAKVQSNCVLHSPLALDFGVYNPATQAGGPLDVVGSVLTVACTRGAPGVSIALDNGDAYGDSHRNLQSGNGRDLVGYEIYTDATHSTVWNMIQTVAYVPASNAATAISMYGRVLGGQKPHPGHYADTLLAMVNF